MSASVTLWPTRNVREARWPSSTPSAFFSASFAASSFCNYSSTFVNSTEINLLNILFRHTNIFMFINFSLCKLGLLVRGSCSAAACPWRGSHAGLHGLVLHTSAHARHCINAALSVLWAAAARVAMRCYIEGT